MMTSKELVAILEKIRGKSDHLEPERVVAAARPANHPLHDRFEWDDTKAAHQHRLNQARELMRVLVTVTTTVRDVRLPYYQHDAELPAGVQGYVPLKRVLSDEDMRRRQIVQAFSDAAKYLRRAHDIALVLGSSAAEIEMLETAVRRLTSTFEPRADQ